MNEKMSAHKGLPLSKEEVMQLLKLIEANPVLLTKATNASNNQLKEVIWAKITDTFNSVIASCPRKPEQLRLKWENLKKAARKRSTKLRMNNLKTGGGKPDYMPPDESLDKVAAILGATYDGYSVPFGDDDEELVVEVAENVPFECVNVVPDVESISPSLSPHMPQTKKNHFSSAQSKGKLRRLAIADSAKMSVIRRNKSIADYYEAKRRHEEVLHCLKKKKIEMEILELEKKLSKENDL